MTEAAVAIEWDKATGVHCVWMGDDLIHEAKTKAEADDVAQRINAALSRSFIQREAADKMYAGMRAVMHTLEYVHPDDAKLFTDGLDAYEAASRLRRELGA